MKELALALSISFAAVPALALEATLQGTPITAENLVDVLEITRVADAMSNAVDAKEWELVRSFTTDRIETSFGQAKGKTMPADDLIATFKKNLGPAEKESHHMRTNQRIYFEGADDAKMYSRGHIIVTTTPGGEFKDKGGKLLFQNFVRYEHSLVRTDNGWKIDSIKTESIATTTTSLPGKE